MAKQRATRELTQDEIEEYLRSKAEAEALTEEESELKQKKENTNAFKSAEELRLMFEELLLDDMYEEGLIGIVDELALTEHNALSEDKKKEISKMKQLLAAILLTCNCSGDQKTFILLMVERLGYRPLV